MRRWALGVAVAIGAGCGGDDGGGGDPDGRPPVSIDAAVDGTPDADLHGEISIAVRNPGGNGEPEAGADVFIVDGDGTRSMTADGDGNLRATILPGASVTIVHRAGLSVSGVRLVTVMDVRPGDELDFSRRGPALQPIRGEMTFHAAPFAGAVRHVSANGCNTGTASADQVMRLRFSPRCGAGPHDILVMAQNIQGQLLAYKTLLDVPFAAGGGPIEVPGDYIAASRFQATYDAPASGHVVQLLRSALHDGLSYASNGGQANVVDGASAISVAYPTVGDRMRVRSSVYRDTRPVGPRQIIQDLAASASTYALDFRAVLQPWLVDARIDLATWTVSFTQDSTEATQPDADVLMVRLFYETGTGPEERLNEWYVLAPPDTTAVQLPILPAALASLGPNAANPPQGEIDRVDFSDREGYDAVRPVAERDAGDLDGVVTATRIRRSSTTF